jgi:hypothetical protein
LYETWISLRSAEDSEPNLLSIVVSRCKLEFLKGSNFPEFSTILQQKWDVFGRRMMIVWFILVMLVFILFQVHIGFLLDMIKGIPNAQSIQQRLANVLYIIAGVFLFLDTAFEYSNGILRIEREIDEIGATCPINTSQNPIDISVVDVPPWTLDGQLRNIYNEPNIVGESAAEPESIQVNQTAASAALSTLKKSFGNCFKKYFTPSKSCEAEIKAGLRDLSRFVSNRHRFALHSAGASSEEAVDACSSASHEVSLGWIIDKTKLFRHFVGYNYCARSSLECCASIRQHKLSHRGDINSLDVVLATHKATPTHDPEHDILFFKLLSCAHESLIIGFRMLSHMLKCLFGLMDSRTLYSHLWCISLLLSGIFLQNYKNNDVGLSFAAAAVVFKFLYILRFFLLIEPLGVYMAMIMRMLSTDLALFMAVAVVYLVAFGEAFVLLGSVLAPELSPETFFFTQFKWVIGDSDTGSFDSNSNALALNPVLYRISYIFFFIFVILLNICLLNMLTAMFTKTYESYTAQAQAVHRYNTARITLSLERVLYNLPVPILWLLGFRSSLPIFSNPFSSVSLSAAQRRPLSGRLQHPEPPPTKYIFRHHWTAFNKYVSFWPSKFTFVNCRTGYPLDSMHSLFQKDVALPWGQALFSFFVNDLSPDKKHRLRMNAPRAFYSMQHILEIIRERTQEIVSSASNRGGYVDHQFKEDFMKCNVFSSESKSGSSIEEHLANCLRSQKTLKNVMKMLKVFVLDSSPSTSVDVFMNQFMQYLCIFIEKEYVDNEQYHLLTMDFPSQPNLKDTHTQALQ